MNSPIGHNKTRVGGVAVEQLKSIISRIEKLTEEKDGIAADILDVLAEAKGNGYNVKAIRTIIKMRKQDTAQREEEETVLETYMNCLGMLPLFEQIDEPDDDATEQKQPAVDWVIDDEIYAHVVGIVLREQHAELAKLVERYEREGIVGSANNVGKREVLCKPKGEAA